ncbi:hypothetical protein L195_g026973, partial [Trifolium pratense]
MDQASTIEAEPSIVLHSKSKKVVKSRESSFNSEYEGSIGEEPSRYEVWGCQLQILPKDPVQDWQNNHHGMVCSDKEIHL